MRITSKLGVVLIAFLAFSGLAACGGGGSDAQFAPPVGPPNPPPPPVAPPPPQLPPAPPSPFPAPTSAAPYYLASGSAGQIVEGWTGHLIVVDPASPTTPFAVESSTPSRQLWKFQEATMDTVTASVRDLHTRFVVYVKDRRIHRLDLKRGVWPPAPKIVSSFALLLPEACDASARAIRDRQTPERSLLVFKAPGPDGICFTPDDGEVAMRVDMSETDTPIFVGSELIGALHTTTGAISSFVVRSGKQIRKVTAEFANPVDLFALSGYSNSFVVKNGDGLDLPDGLKGQLLYVADCQLRAHDLDSGLGSRHLLTLNQPDSDCWAFAAASDADSVYLLAGTRSREPSLIRVSNTDSVDVLATGSIAGVKLTPSRVLYWSRDFSNETKSWVTEYRSVPKAGGAPVTVIPASACQKDSIVFVAGENVWYYCGTIGNDWDYGLIRAAADYSNSPSVGVVRSDGTEPHKFYNSWIAGVIHANPMPLTPDGSTIHAIAVAHYQRATESQERSTVLRAYEGATRTELFTYGSLPGNLMPDYKLPFDSFQWSQPVLIEAGDWASTGGIGQRRELYFLQSDAAGLTRVTDFVH